MKKIFVCAAIILIMIEHSVSGMERELTKTEVPKTSDLPPAAAADSLPQTAAAAASSAQNDAQRDVSYDEIDVTERIVRVENKTNDSLLVRYENAESAYCERTLIPNQWVDFSPHQLKLLEVKPYGYYKGLVSAETLRMQLTNLTSLVRAESKRLGTPKVKLSVHPKIDASRSGWLAYPITILCEKVLAYVCTCDYTELLDEYHSIGDALPQLAKGVREGRYDEPRLALSIGINSTTDNMEFVYQHLRGEWERKSHSSDAEMVRLAQAVVTILDAAHLALVNRADNTENFSTLVKKYFIQGMGAPYAVFSNAAARALFNAFLYKRGFALFSWRRWPATCQEAIRGLAEFTQNNSLRMQAFLKSRPGVEAVVVELGNRYFSPGNVKPVHLVQPALLMATPEAQEWLLHRISREDYWRYNYDAVYKILEGFDKPFHKPLIDELAKDVHCLNLIDGQNNSLLMRSILDQNFDLALFLMDRFNGVVTHVDRVPWSAPRSPFPTVHQRQEPSKYNFRVSRNATIDCTKTNKDGKTALQLAEDYKAETRKALEREGVHLAQDQNAQLREKLRKCDELIGLLANVNGHHELFGGHS